MKIRYTALLAFTTMLFYTVTYAEDISGVIAVDTLRVENSPYNVVGNLFLPFWQTLVIEPGVALKFNSGLNFIIDGAFKAEGTSSDSIKFTSNNGLPASGDWIGLILRNVDSVSIKYAVFEYSEEAISADNSSATISNSIFQNNANAGIRCDASSPRISQNILRNNSNEAIECVNNANPEIWQNTIYQNDFGITLNDVSAPSIKNNIIASNQQIGIANNDSSSPTIQYNNVWSNGTSDYLGTAADIGTLAATNANGDSSDVHFNISLEPLFVNPGGSDFQLQVASPAIDAGDPTNPAGIIMWGAAPDVGAFEYGASVPVELISFQMADGVLRWATASETNNFGFEVQRSDFEQGPFFKIGFVAGAGTTTLPRTYEFKDEVRTSVYFYRLKQIDLDGSFEFSQILKAAYSNPSSFTLFQNYPNPFNPTTTISFQIPETISPDGSGFAKLTIFNALGQEVSVPLDERKASGTYEIQWNGLDRFSRPVSSGVYFYRLKYGDSVLIRKMILSR